MYINKSIVCGYPFQEFHHYLNLELTVNLKYDKYQTYISPRVLCYENDTSNKFC